MPVKITKYAPPTAPDAFVLVTLLGLYGLGASAPWITPGTEVWGLLNQHVPGGAERVVWVARTVVPLIVGAHLLEAIVFDILRLQRHGVPRFSALWWKWEISTFLEGMAVWKRVGKVIAAAEKEAKRK